MNKPYVRQEIFSEIRYGLCEKFWDLEGKDNFEYCFNLLIHNSPFFYVVPVQYDKFEFGVISSIFRGFIKHNEVNLANKFLTFLYKETRPYHLDVIALGGLVFRTNLIVISDDVIHTYVSFCKEKGLIDKILWDFVTRHGTIREDQKESFLYVLRQLNKNKHFSFFKQVFNTIKIENLDLLSSSSLFLCINLFKQSNSGAQEEIIEFLNEKQNIYSIHLLKVINNGKK
jgi:hypothetical protein